MNIYVGNLSFQATEEELRQAFEEFGQVASVNVIKDKYTGESRGFAFVQMPSDEEAKAAIENLNGRDLGGRSLRVSEAKPRPERGGGPGGGMRRGGERGGWGERRGGRERSGGGRRERPW